MVNYGANEGIEWIVLTNAVSWQLYRIKFAQPIEHEEVASFSFVDLDLRKDDDKKKAFLLTREAITDDVMDAYHQESQLFNRYTVTQVMRQDAVVAVIRREFRKLFPDIKVDKEDIAELLDEEILKRDVLESDKVKDARSRIKRAEKKLARKSAKKEAKIAKPVNDESVKEPKVKDNEDAI